MREDEVKPSCWAAGATGYCLETHDLLVSKYLAGRPKDFEFCTAVVKAGLVSEGVLKERLADTSCSPEQRDQATAMISRDFMADEPEKHSPRRLQL